MVEVPAGNSSIAKRHGRHWELYKIQVVAVFTGRWDIGYMSVWRTCRIRRLERLKTPNHRNSSVSPKADIPDSKGRQLFSIGVLVQVYFPAWPEHLWFP